MKARHKMAKHNFYYKDEEREISLTSDHPGYFQNCLARILEAEIIPPMEEEEQVYYASSIIAGQPNSNLDQGTGAPEFGHEADEANTLLGTEPEKDPVVRVPGYAGEPPDDIAYLKSPRARGEGLPDPLDE